MSEEAIFLNSGPLFSGERLEGMEDLGEWTKLEEEARLAYNRIREAFEKHSTLLAGSPSLEETRFFMINPTLHALGYTHSVYEPVPTSAGSVARVDYALFPNAQSFTDAIESRGSIAFYRAAAGLGKAVAWTGDLDTPPPARQARVVVRDEDEDEDEAPVRLPAQEDTSVPGILPAAELDALMRETGVNFGLLTNGWLWRVYHRGTSDRLDTFFQADLIAAIKSDFEDFKRFYMLFHKGAFVKGANGSSFIDSMLA